MNERVREIRKALGLTQLAFGERLGLKQNTIATIESGKRGVTQAFALAVCRAFGVNPDYLLDGQGQMFAPKESLALDRIDRLLSGEGPAFAKAVLMELSALSGEEWALLEGLARRILRRAQGGEGA